jgi:hypothetical protein
MTDTNPGGWPDPAKPGYPISRGRKGAHVLDGGPDHTGKRRRIVALWTGGSWHLGTDYSVLARDAAKWGWQYVGPCFTPAEVADLIEAVRREEREACAEVAEGHKGRYRTWPWWINHDGSEGTRNDSDIVKHADQIAYAIRARGDA